MAIARTRDTLRTKEQILRLLIQSQDGTVEALSRNLQINPSVVRRHLDDLVASGLAESHYERISRGRPKRAYSISIKGRDSLFGKYDVFSDLVMSTILKNQGIESAKEIFHEAAIKMALDSGIPEFDPDRLVTFLAGMGFEPEARSENGADLMISHNCPIIQISKKYPELACDVFHTDFLKEATGNQKVILKQAISRGAKYCIHEM